MSLRAALLDGVTNQSGVAVDDVGEFSVGSEIELRPVAALSGDPLHLNLVGVLFSLCQIVGGLEPKPRFCAAAERLIETSRHFGGNGRLTMNQIVERLARDTESSRRGSDGESQRFRQSDRTDKPGCSGFFMGVVLT